MIINGERSLAYIVTIDEIKPIEGYDRVEYARTNGWWVVVSKNDNFKVGDKAVYFEIDSKLPETDERFKFLEPKKYRVKTQKMCKVYSQGLLMPVSAFPDLTELAVGTDVAKRLGVTYYIEEDNARKAKPSELKYKAMASRHPKWFRSKPFRWLMKRDWGKKLLFVFFGKRRDNPKKWPYFVKKTDEERIELMPWRCGDGKAYIVTEKLDGTSTTMAMLRKKFGRFEYYVCSRNVRQMDEKQETYHDHNIYWDMAFKYDVEKHLKEYLKEHPDEDWVYIQGESVGKVQGNPLKLEEDDFYVFNFVTANFGRFDSIKGSNIIKSWGMKWVPILGYAELPDNMEDTKIAADGKSIVNPKVMREGLVYRSLDGHDSFKNVSRKYLLKHES